MRFHASILTSGQNARMNRNSSILHHAFIWRGQTAGIMVFRERCSDVACRGRAPAGVFDWRGALRAGRAGGYAAAGRGGVSVRSTVIPDFLIP